MESDNDENGNQSELSRFLGNAKIDTLLTRAIMTDPTLSGCIRFAIRRTK